MIAIANFVLLIAEKEFILSNIVLKSKTWETLRYENLKQFLQTKSFLKIPSTVLVIDILIMSSGFTDVAKSW